MPGIMVKAFLALSFVPGLCFSTGLPRLAPSAWSGFEPLEDTVVEDAASPLIISKDSIPYGATNDNGGLFFPHGRAAPFQSSPSANKGLLHSLPSIRAGVITSSSVPGGVWNEGTHELYSNDSNLAQTSQILHELENYLLGDEASGVGETPLADFRLHQEPDVASCSEKGPLDPSLFSSLLTEDDQERAHHPMELPIAATRSDGWFSTWAQPIATEASSVHPTIHAISRTEVRHERAPQKSHGRVLGAKVDTLDMPNSEDARGYLPHIYNADVTLADSLSVTKTLWVHSMGHGDPCTVTKLRGPSQSAQIPDFTKQHILHINKKQDTQGYHPENTLGNILSKPDIPGNSSSFLKRSAQPQTGDELGSTRKKPFLSMEGTPMKMQEPQEFSSKRENAFLINTTAGGSMSLPSHTELIPPERTEIKVSPNLTRNLDEISNDSVISTPSESKRTCDASTTSNPLSLNETHQVTMVNIEDANKNLIPWISSIHYIFKKDELTPFEEYKSEFFQLLNKNKLTYIKWLWPGVSSQGLQNDIYPKILHIFGQFIKILWCLNSIFLKHLKYGKKGKRIHEEKRELIHWLVNEIMYSSRDSNKFSSTISYSHEELAQLKSQVQTLIYDSFHVEDDGRVWEIDSKNSSVRYKEIRISRIKLTEAAIVTLISYFKSTNPLKWKHFFPEDKIFLLFLASTHNSKNSHPWKNNILSLSRCLKGYILPWRETLSFKRSIPTHVNILSNVNDSDELEKFIKNNMDLIEGNPADLRLFSPSNPDMKAFVWISTVPENNSSLLFMTITENLRFDLEKWMEFGAFQSKEAALNTIHDISRKIWMLNRSLLQLLGTEESSNKFESEQISVIVFFSQLLGWISPEPTIEPYQSEIFLRSTSNLMGSKNDPLSWRVPASWSHTNGTITYFKKISHNDVILTRLAINVLGSYYKATNYDKWIELFEYDVNLLAILIQIANRMFWKTNEKVIFQRKKSLKSVNILPWKNPFSLDSDQVKKIKDRCWMFRRFDSQRENFAKGVLENITQEVETISKDEIN